MLRRGRCLLVPGSWGDKDKDKTDIPSVFRPPGPGWPQAACDTDRHSPLVVEMIERYGRLPVAEYET